MELHVYSAHQCHQSQCPHAILANFCGSHHEGSHIRADGVFAAGIVLRHLWWGVPLSSNYQALEAQASRPLYGTQDVLAFHGEREYRSGFCDCVAAYASDLEVEAARKTEGNTHLRVSAWIFVSVSFGYIYPFPSSVADVYLSICGVSLARVALVHIATIKHDYTNASTDAFAWSTVEANTGIVCASVLALKPLFVKLFPRFMRAGGTAKHSTVLTNISPSCGDLEEGEDKVTTTRGYSYGGSTLVPFRSTDNPVTRVDSNGTDRIDWHRRRSSTWLRISGKKIEYLA